MVNSPKLIKLPVVDMVRYSIDFNLSDGSIPPPIIALTELEVVPGFSPLLLVMSPKSDASVPFDAIMNTSTLGERVLPGTFPPAANARVGDEKH